ncbi:unnamed protein product [Prorocentrum cordatum]|uniref:Uncharacterized protein n=1 Tax=Prorocentrum cordatum TaxID=2364126 RepID=A0ABN9R180_9DINO|nr:unnamed protein product [Polarella glacialis]
MLLLVCIRRKPYKHTFDNPPWPFWPKARARLAGPGRPSPERLALPASRLGTVAGCAQTSPPGGPRLASTGRARARERAEEGTRGRLARGGGAARARPAGAGVRGPPSKGAEALLGRPRAAEPCRRGLVAGGGRPSRPGYAGAEVVCEPAAVALAGAGAHVWSIAADPTRAAGLAEPLVQRWSPTSPRHGLGGGAQGAGSTGASVSSDGDRLQDGLDRAWSRGLQRGRPSRSRRAVAAVAVTLIAVVAIAMAVVVVAGRRRRRERRRRFRRRRRSFVVATAVVVIAVGVGICFCWGTPLLVCAVPRGEGLVYACRRNTRAMTAADSRRVDAAVTPEQAINVESHLRPEPQEP